MIISTATRKPGRAGFTLAEVMIGATLSTFILAGVLSTFLMLGRSGASVVNYATMDIQTRRALEEFGQDVRMASAVTWNNDASVTLTVPDNYTGSGNKVTYAWDNDSSSGTYRCFYRFPGDTSVVNPTKTVYVRNVTTFTFKRYDRGNVETSVAAATKRLQMRLTVTTSARTTVNTTDSTVSASFILRNKSVS